MALSLQLSLLEEELAGDGSATAQLERARGEIDTSLEELREIAQGIHPAVVSGHGLAVALEQLAARAQVPVRLSVEIEGRLPEAVEVAAYYLISESARECRQVRAGVAGHGRSGAQQRTDPGRGHRRRDRGR